MTAKIEIRAKNCYGIPSLNHTFDFSNSDNPSVLIYAPNGLMKTSLTKSLLDYSQGRKPTDQVFERVTDFSVNDEDGNPFPQNHVFVVQSIDEKFKSGRVSNLLASAKLKAEYDSIFSSLSDKKAKLLQKLKKTSGLSKDIDTAICSAFGLDQNEFMIALERMEKEVRRGEHIEFKSVRYKTIFDAKVIELLEKPSFMAVVEQYANAYSDLLTKSKFFKRGVFNHTNADMVAKNLSDNGWFKGGHSVSLNTSSENPQPYDNVEKLKEDIEDEKRRILSDDGLEAIFAQADQEFSNAPLRAFRDHIIEHPFVVLEFKNMKRLKQKIWVSYLSEFKESFLELTDEYDSTQESIKSILNRAEGEGQQWEDVKNTFNRRFSVPFKVDIRNRADSVLGLSSPQIEFVFEDKNSQESKKIQDTDLVKILSNGEKRAFYILNILFEINAIMNSRNKTLIVFDDIADSFDYQNKYAIVEYLNEVSKSQLFFPIILTHNFDFYRTVKSRCGVRGENKLLASKVEGEIKFSQDAKENNPLIAWSENLDNKSEMVVCIPFARNLIEYTHSEEDVKFSTLTRLLHLKNGSENISFEDLSLIYAGIFSKSKSDKCVSDSQSVWDFIFAECDSIIDPKSLAENLLQKVILSIGVRLKTEQFLHSSLRDKKEVKRQTGRWIGRFKKENPNASRETLGTLDQVLLMTSENIHMNSFMFEPILDMSPDHLIELYEKVKAL